MEIFAPLYPGSHHPGSHLVAWPGHPGVGWVLPHPDWDHQTLYQPDRRPERPERTKRSRSKSHTRSGLDSKRKKTRTGAGTGTGPTDSDIEKTYTGRDRELAEEFIEQTMEARTESEAW